MKFLITINDDPTTAYLAIGNRNDLQDAAYDAGAMGVTIMVLT